MKRNGLRAGESVCSTTLAETENVKKSAQCCVPLCSDHVKVDKHSFTWDDVCRVNGIATVNVCGADIAGPLCSSHYQVVYRLVNVVQDVHCCVCGVRRKHEHTTSATFLPCPQPKLVEAHLHNLVGFERYINEEDMLCSGCYKYFNEQLKSAISVMSSDDIVLALKAKEMHIYEDISKFSLGSDDSYVVLAMYKVALDACKLLISEQAFLFPRLYKSFLQYIPDRIAL